MGKVIWSAWVSKSCHQLCKHHSCGKWCLQCRKWFVIMNWNLRLQCKTDIVRNLVGTTNKNARPGKWLVTETTASEVCLAFVHGSRKSRWAAQQLWVPLSTVQKILQACFIFKLQNQLLQHIIPQDKDIRYTFCCNVLSNHIDDKLFTTKIIFRN
jgi:hypothetical protein